MFRRLFRALWFAGELLLFAGRFIVLSYAVDDGSVAQDVCYWGDMTFFPHLVNLMTKKQVRARVNLTPIAQLATDRKELARQFHAEVVRLGSALDEYPDLPAGH